MLQCILLGLEHTRQTSFYNIKNCHKNFNSVILKENKVCKYFHLIFRVIEERKVEQLPRGTN